MAPKSKKGKSSGSQKVPKTARNKEILSVSEETAPMNMESIGHPEIYPLLLTTKTQEIFNCRANEDFTDEQPYKLIKKQDIFADFHKRAAVSDFYPFKKIIQEYPGDELLLVYDKDFKYGLNFYLIGTEEGKENYLNPPAVSKEQEEHKEFKEHVPEDVLIYKPPVSKPWVSLGSEKEIEEESVKESTKQITYMISRKRSEFGAPIKFSDQNASSVKDAYIECTAYPDKNFTLKKLEKDVGMQAVPQVKDTSTQTRWTYPQNATIQYYPREFLEEEKEILGQSKPVTNFLNNVSISVEIALQQNEIMNTFIDDWKCLAEEEGTFGDKSDTHLKEYQSFTDLHNLTEKMITCVSWHPEIYGEMEETITLSKGKTSLDHCPTKISLCEDCLLSKAQDKLLAQNKVVKVEETNPYRNLESGLANILRPIDDFCTKFFVGTEEGEIIYTDWKLEKDPETGRLMTKKPVNLCTVHDGAVHTVQRSPFYKDIILTIGGWNMAIWKEGVMTGPLLQSCCVPKRYTAGHWSLTRPSVFYIGREDGYIDIWDLLEKTHEPAQSQNICITMITSIKPWAFSAKQQFIAVGDYYGTLHILEIPWTLSRPSANEASSVSHYFEREVRHLEYVEQRKKIREQEKKEMELETEKKKVKTYQKSKEQVEAELKMDYESYLELEKTVLFNLGLMKVTDTMSFTDMT
ncbi:PREDICTED: WD repeat-containing protein 63 [Hipposideros armiger]|uniref:Dynein axonemal intermediate chain 3 n=1 Tax=Hipposideros armiger TaxID=186990 RepID=A0A8B7Q350_HIPAR|nr:PREDICTED: WD repeat-containing protein 63 [Hipposideros armiger]